MSWDGKIKTVLRLRAWIIAQVTTKQEVQLEDVTNAVIFALAEAKPTLFRLGILRAVIRAIKTKDEIF